jgi:hypothetical protein
MARLNVQLGHTACKPAAEQTARVSWQGAERGDVLELNLLWYTQGKGAEDIEVVAQEMLQNINNSGEREFTFSLPTFPWSFSGKLISLSWALEAHLTKSELTERVDFVLSPTGAEILLKR